MKNNGNSKLTIPNLVKEAVEKYSDKNSLVFVGEKNYTYGEMGADIEKVASLLSVLGVEKGDKVAILSTNMPNWGVSFLAISVLGAVAVPILPDFHENEIKTIIEHSEAKLIFVSAGLYENLSAQSQQLVEHIILVDTFAIVPKNTHANKIM